jgi:antitoxin HigA-1
MLTIIIIVINVNKNVYFRVMESEINILKGIHPGFILERKLKENGLKKSRFALDINEYPQTLTTITKGRRDMNLPLALKIEEALGLKEGYFMMLQLYHDIKKQKELREKQKPDLSQFRKVLFWDTDIHTIDWERQWKSIIKRVLERGNQKEKAEINRFYGKQKIKETMNQLRNKQ